MVSRIDILIEKAQTQFELDQFEQAAGTCEQILRDHRDPQIQRMLAQSYLKLGRNHEAMKSFEAVVEAFPDDEASLTELGRLAKETGDLDRAEKVLERSCALHPKKPDLYLELGRLQIGRRQYDKAAKSFGAVLELLPGHSEATLELGKLLVVKDDLEGARQVFANAVDNDPDNARLHFELGEVYNLLGQYQDAILEYKRAERLDPNNSVVHWRIGKDLEGKGKFDEALEKYEVVRQLDPNNLEVLYRVAKIQQRKGDADAAILAFKEIVKRKENWLEIRQELANLYAEKGMFQEQAQELEAIAAMDGASEDVLLNLAAANEQAGNLDKALVYYHKAFVNDPENPAIPERIFGLICAGGGPIENYLDAVEALAVFQPTDPDVFLFLARMYMHQGRVEDANAYYARVLELDPARTDIRGELRAIYQAKGMVTEEMEAIQALLASAPEDVELLRDLFGLQKQLRLRAEATETLRVLMRVSPDPAWSRELAAMCMEQGQSDDAIVMLQRALAENPQDPSPHQALARLYQQKNMPEKAIESLRALVQIDPNDLESHLALGQLYHQLGRIDDQIESLAHAIELGASDPRLFLELGDLYRQRGKTEDAQAMLQQAKQAAPDDPTVSKRLIDIFLCANDHAAAIGELEAMRQQDPENIENYLTLARIYHGQSMFDEAMQVLEQALTVAPGQIQVRIEQAKLLIEANRAADAVDLLKNLTIENPDNQQLALELAIAHVKAGEEETAILELKELLKIDEANVQARVQLGRVFALTNQVDQAIMEFKRAVKDAPELPDGHVELGRMYVTMGRSFNDTAMIGSGADEIREALRLDPNNINAHFELGCVLKDENKVIEALAEFELVLKHMPYHTQCKSYHQELSALKVKSMAEEHMQQARIFNERGMLKNAILEYETVINLQPDNHQALFDLGSIYREQNQLEKAIEFFSRARDTKQDFLEAYVALGQACIAANRPDDAAIELQALLGIEPNHFDGLVMLGGILQQKGWFDEAIEQYEKAHQINAMELTPPLQMAKMAKEKGDLEAAKKWFNKVINLDAGNAEAGDFFANLKASEKSAEITDLASKAKTAEEKGEIDEAIMHYDAIIDLDSKNLDARYHLGRLYESKNMFDEATFEYEQALAVDGDSQYKDIFIRLGQLFQRKGKIVEAVDALRQAKRHFLENAEVRIALVNQMKFKAMNNFTTPDELVEYCQEVRGAAETTPTALNLLEMGLLVSKGLDATISEEDALAQSIGAFEKVLEIEPQNTLALIELAKVYFRKNSLDQVEQIYRKIFELDPENTYAHRKMAELYVVTKRYDEAMSEFRQLVELEVGNGDNHMRIIDLHKEMNAKNESKQKVFLEIINQLKAQVEQNPKDVMASFSLGYAYLTLSSGFSLTDEERQWAVYYFKQANAADPTNLWPYWGLKLVYNKESIAGKHMYDEAIAICKKALKQDENSARAHFELGESYNENYDVNMKNEAMQEYRKAIQLDPLFVEAHFRLASIYRVKNMFDKAVEEYNKVIELDATGPLAKDAKRSLVHIERSRGEG